MKKSDLKFIIVFLLILGFAGVYLYRSTYAKYRRRVDANFTATIASWNIKVNDEMIINKTTLENEITPVINNSQYVKEGTLAPGTTGYFDLVINSEEVDVDFTYDISITTNADTELLDFVITSYSINGTTMVYDPDTDTSIVGDLAKNTGDTTLRITFAWNDGRNNKMNNQADTEYAANSLNKITNVNVIINFAQKN